MVKTGPRAPSGTYDTVDHRYQKFSTQREAVVFTFQDISINVFNSSVKVLRVLHHAQEPNRTRTALGDPPRDV